MRKLLLAIFVALLPLATLAQQSAQTSGTLIVLPASGEVRHANDRATLLFVVEEQDRDKSAAASRVNQKMKQGIDILKSRDPSAQLKTQGYSSYPVYPQQEARTNGTMRQPVGWRVRQALELTTGDLAGLPATVAAAQGVLALAQLRFGLADATARKMDEDRIAATYRNLGERMVAVARAMGRNPADAVLESVDFEASGDIVPAAVMAKSMAMSAAPAPAVEEPSFEPGETTLQMRAVGKIRFR
ncbi:SIMPL domain-containing protein [Noviherbaspirillum pedocola]|uniref:SIMPL domain-containing protein n=1 Tax=Noviherbaspirillum pedocola TaxID=2801341 RepID=A0A934W695_9BURK|nr:SIMPL domain-containing protein [Noviherbaspirillum pedocola]MBK4734098.1 SIMPL domain-containing protein [Noviherbaspirillum pedocola]